MKLLTLTPALLLLASLPLAAEQNTLAASEKSAGFQLLFNGRDLTGWEGDPDIWSVRDGLIIGSTEKKDLEANTFLITKKSYGDFHLKAEIKLRNHNSGIQFRSQALDDYVVTGYQADAAEGNWWGSLYGEKTGRGVIVNGWQGKGEKVVKDGWNSYEIICKGRRITIKLNGMVTVELDDDMALEGIIALQVHRGPKMEVAFRNLKIKTL
jgi:hypothetical protein